VAALGAAASAALSDVARNDALTSGAIPACGLFFIFGGANERALYAEAEL
jgi:hypothetical protein